MEPSDGGHAKLEGVQIVAPGLHPVEVAELGARGQEVGRTLDAVYYGAIQLGTGLDGTPAQGTAESTHDQGNSGTGCQQEEGKDQRQIEIEAAKEEGGQGRDKKCSQRRGDRPQKKVLERLDVGHDPREQVSGTVLRQARWGQGLERLVEPGAQPGEQPEGDIVREEALQVAQNAARDPEKAHTDDGHA